MSEIRDIHDVNITKHMRKSAIVKKITEIDYSRHCIRPSIRYMLLFLILVYTKKNL